MMKPSARLSVTHLHDAGDEFSTDVSGNCKGLQHTQDASVSCGAPTGALSEIIIQFLRAPLVPCWI